MRIISGKYKGRKLISFDEDHIRPTTDRVKESLFNILSPSIEGASVLDLYSGTGNLSFEALSRGARLVISVEKSLRSLKIIKKNVELLKISDSLEIYKEDALDFVREYEGDPFDIILIDPPFPSKICQKTLEEIERGQVANSETQIAIEHSRQEPLPEKIGTLTRVDTRSYGDKILAFYRKGR